MEELGWQVLLFDYRGCGDSVGNFSIKGWLEDVSAAVAYLKADLGAKEIWLAGFGMGGPLAVGCACAGGEEKSQPDEAMGSVKEVAGVISAGAPADFSSWAENSGQLLEYSRELGIISDSGFPADEQSWKDELLDFKAENYSGKMSDRPFLILHGSEDTMVPSLDARAIAESHSGAEIRIMEGVSQEMSLDPRVLAVILGWLRRNGSLAKL